MHRSIITFGLVAALAVATVGCKSFVKLTPDAEQVRASSPATVEACERIGRTKARTSAKAWIFPRRQHRVEEDLLNLARVDAAEMGGTDVAPLGEAADGRQEFGIYKCAAASSADSE